MMLAATCHANKDKQAVYELQRVPKPTLNGLPAGSLLVRTVAASICGTDLFGQNESTGRQAIGYLDALSGCCGGSGHEVLGQVEQVVEPCQYRIGQRLLVMAPLYIQRMTTLHAIFEKATATNATILPDAGGFAEFIVSHESCCIPLSEPPQQDVNIPVDNPLHFVAAQPLGTIVHACETLNQSVLGKNVAIVGQGPNGLIMTQVLAGMGARRIIVLDLLEERLQIAQRLGATHLIHVTDRDNIELYRKQVEAITYGAMCDIVVEMVGHQPHTFDLASDLTKDGGTVLLFGILSPSGSTIHVRHFARSLQYVCSSAPHMKDFELAVELIAQGRFDPKPLFSHMFHFKSFPEAYNTASQYKDSVAKVLLTFDGSEQRSSA